MTKQKDIIESTTAILNRITKTEVFELALLIDSAKHIGAYGEYVAINLSAAKKAGCVNINEMQAEFDKLLAAYKKQEGMI